jgi:hypothetical protein
MARMAPGVNEVMIFVVVQTLLLEYRRKTESESLCFAFQRKLSTNPTPTLKQKLGKQSARPHFHTKQLKSCDLWSIAVDKTNSNAARFLLSKLTKKL